MKNKKVIYLLLGVVLLVWGLIFYRLFSGMGPSENRTSSSTGIYKDSTEKNVADTFSIVGHYRDPFLGTMASDKPEIKPGPHVALVAKVLPPPLAWPVTGYGGMIKNQKSNKQLVLIQINSQNHLMKTGDAMEGIQLLKITKDSVELSFQKGKKWVKK